jgi:hypothetical protein
MGKIPFMPKAKPPSHHSDIRALSALVTKRSLTPWITRAAILVVVTWIWLWICRQILVFGELMRYDRLEPLGPQVVSFLTKMNPYLWWVITAILTLILLSVIRAWLKNSIARSRKTLLSVGDLQQLVGVMSPEGVEVLQWVWDDEQGPITLGDLLRAREEIRFGRPRKLAMVRAQQAALQNARRADGSPVADPTIEFGSTSSRPEGGSAAP